MNHYQLPAGVEVLNSNGVERFNSLLSKEAVEFIAKLHRTYNERRQQLLAQRNTRQFAFDRGELPNFLDETKKIRQKEWTVAPIPKDLLDRRVEITGPPERKMIINALNSGAKVFMADFEDSNSPTWESCMEGQLNLRDAVDGTISFVKPDGKEYRLNEKVATLMVRPRGWHLWEKHLRIDGEPVSASLFDFGLYFFHNAKNLLAKGSGPYFYLPKLESHLEARLWNDVFRMAQEMLGIPVGSIRATVLIETITAVFEMDEILYELREHSAGLNCGRWDYIFSFIKRFRSRPDFVLPNRSQITMGTHFLHSYSQLAIRTCHRRGIHAMGGMAAQIPIKNDQVANEQALAKVRADKEREVRDGHDGTWVAHPGLVPVAMEIFDREMTTENQISRKREDVAVTQDDLLQVPQGEITEEGLRINIDVGIQYLASWLGGEGCVPIYNLMEDAATSEISRTQVWQWIHHPAGVLADGRQITVELTREFIEQEVDGIRLRVGDKQFQQGKYKMAQQLFDKLATSNELSEFLTLAAYEQLD